MIFTYNAQDQKDYRLENILNISEILVLNTFLKSENEEKLTRCL